MPFSRSNLFVFKDSPFFNKPLFRITHTSSGYVTNLANKGAKNSPITIVLVPTQTVYF
jgi:hypothetical protein